MAHEMQLEKTDCGIACCAMLAGVDYFDAWLMANTYAEHWDTRGMSTNDMIHVLKELTERRYRFRRLPYPRPLLVRFSEWPAVAAIAIIRADRDRQGHMIAWNPRGKRIHDPQHHCGLPLATYRKWIDPTVRVIGFILPCEDETPDDAP